MKTKIPWCDAPMTKTGKGAGRDNGNWSGGKSITSHGYVLIRVGTEHPMADVRGYCYEHRLVATKMLGRELLSGELVHHKNGIRTDNRPENLEIVESISHHLVKHRKLSDSGRRLPDESNPVISCKCGCCQQFSQYDKWGRPRLYLSGHNPIPRRENGTYKNSMV